MEASRRSLQTNRYSSFLSHNADGKSKGVRYPFKASFYLNGEFLDARESKRYVQSSIPFHVGSFYDNRYPFLGCIGSVMVYNTALTSTEVVDLARYHPVQDAVEAEQLFVKLRPEVISERIGQTMHLLGVSSVRVRMTGNVQINEEELEGRDEAEEFVPREVVEEKEEEKEEEEEEEKENLMVDSTFHGGRFTVDSKRVRSRLRNGVSDMDLFRNSLREKDISHLKSGKYHFSLPSSLERKYSVVNTARADRVRRAMQFVWKK